jgi:protein-disulfide isomerase
VLDGIFVIALLIAALLWWKARTAPGPVVPGEFPSDAPLQISERVEQLARYVGPQDPAAHVITFFDFSCGWCLESDASLRALLARYPDHLGVSFVDFVLDSTSHVSSAHEAAHCAADERSFRHYSAAAFARQSQLSERNGWTSALLGLPDSVARSVRRCVASGVHRKRVANASDFARSLGLTITPSYLIDGRLYSGVIEPTVMDSIVVAMVRRATKWTPLERRAALP